MRNVSALERIDLDDDDVGASTPVEKRKQRRIAHVAAVPIGLAVDHDGVEQRRQTGRGHDVIGRQLGTFENLDLAGAYIGRGDENLEIIEGANLLEIDGVDEIFAQRIRDRTD